MPAYIANLWTTYDFSIAGLPGFHIGAGVNYVARSYSDITNVNSIPSYVIANAAFGYDTRKWGADVNVHNITDRRYFVAANAAGAYVGSTAECVCEPAQKLLIQGTQSNRIEKKSSRR